MIRVLVVLLSLSFVSEVFPQHTMILKSGEHLEGKLVSYAKGRITFTFKGNTITLAESQVSSIHFQAFGDTSSAISQQLTRSRLNGVVTYFFNENYGHRPDVGAEIYILQRNKVDIDTSAIRDYRIIKLLAQIRQASAKALSDSDKIALNKQDIKAFEVCSAIKNSKHAIKLVADGNGSYSTELPPGEYYILIVSQHRKDLTITEVGGKINFTTLTVESGKEYTVNAKFDL